MRVAHHHATQAQRSRPPEREREKTIEPRATSPRIGFAKKSCDRRFARRAWCTGVASITSLFELVPRPASFVRSFRRLGPRIGAPPGRTTGSSEKKNDILLICYALCQAIKKAELENLPSIFREKREDMYVASSLQDVRLHSIASLSNSTYVVFFTVSQNQKSAARLGKHEGLAPEVSRRRSSDVRNGEFRYGLCYARIGCAG